jgi:hypothetical protein
VRLAGALSPAGTFGGVERALGVHLVLEAGQEPITGRLGGGSAVRLVRPPLGGSDARAQGALVRCERSAAHGATSQCVGCALAALRLLVEDVSISVDPAASEGAAKHQRRVAQSLGVLDRPLSALPQQDFAAEIETTPQVFRAVSSHDVERSLVVLGKRPR